MADAKEMSQHQAVAYHNDQIHSVQSLLESLYTQILVERPENIYEFSVNFLLVKDEPESHLAMAAAAATAAAITHSQSSAVHPGDVHQHLASDEHAKLLALLANTSPELLSAHFGEGGLPKELALLLHQEMAQANASQGQQGNLAMPIMEPRMESRPRNHPCEFEGCNKAFISASHLKSHSRTHTGERPFICEYELCQRSFADAGALKRHKRTHTGEKPYRCNMPGCTKSFSESGTLTTHKRTHSRDKPYVCEVEGCGKTFSVVGNLKRHKRCHSGEKPFVCECGRSFTRASTLSQHRESHVRMDSSDVVTQVVASVSQNAMPEGVDGHGVAQHAAEAARREPQHQAHNMGVEIMMPQEPVTSQSMAMAAFMHLDSHAPPPVPTPTEYLQ